MSDIIMSKAWECGDYDCPVQWHKADYWIQDEPDEDGNLYTVDNYSDGDHESVEESDIPSYEEQNESWVNYSRYVARTGADPLDEFIIKRTQREAWRFRFSPSLLGMVLVEAQRGRKPVPATALPAHVKSYLNLDKDCRVLGDFKGLDGIKKFERTLIPCRKWHCHTFDAPIPAKWLRRRLKAAAKAHLAREGATL